MAATVPATSTGSTKLDGAVQKVAEPAKLSGLALYSRFVRISLLLDRQQANFDRLSLAQCAVPSHTVASHLSTCKHSSFHIKKQRDS